MNKTVSYRLLAALALAATACAGPSVVGVGASIRHPEPPPPVIQIAVLDALSASPVIASVMVGDVPATLDETGTFGAIWPEQPTDVNVSAPGYLTSSTTVLGLPEDGPVQVLLEPVVLEGRIVGPNGEGLVGAWVTLPDGDLIRADTDGTFRIERAVAGELVASKPAFLDTTVAWDGVSETVEIPIEPRMIRALRVGGPVAGNPAAWQELLDLADTTAVNAFVVDTKNEDGTVFHNTEVKTAHEISAVQAFYDLDQVISDMDAHDLYKITRIVTFQDNPLAKAKPEISARDENTGETWRNYKGLRWLDPTDRESWEYALELAEEACARGFDEIQFDYVRFPSDGDISTLEFDLPYTEEVRVETITAFLQEAHGRLNPMGCAVAADIFAITLESSSDEGIGQQPGPLSNYADVLSPMIYTYTYGSGWKGFENPNEHAIAIVTSALDNGMSKLEGSSIYRPWIQTWLLDPSEMRQVQDSVEDRGLGWMIWSANTYYEPAMLAATP